MIGNIWSLILEDYHNPNPIGLSATVSVSPIKTDVILFLSFNINKLIFL
jgi:hypothetical protein